MFWRMASILASACASGLVLTGATANAVEVVVGCDEAAWGTSRWLVERISALVWSTLAAAAAFAASTVFGTCSEAAGAEDGSDGAGAEADGSLPSSTTGAEGSAPSSAAISPRLRLPPVKSTLINLVHTLNYGVTKLEEKIIPKINLKIKFTQSSTHISLPSLVSIELAPLVSALG